MKAAPGGPQAQFQGNKRITQEQIDAWLSRWCLQPTDANTADRSSRSATTSSSSAAGSASSTATRPGSQAFFSDQGGLNFLPAALGGGTNGVIHGDLGYGIQSGRPVTELIAERIPADVHPGRHRARPVGRRSPSSSASTRRSTATRCSTSR